MSETERTTPAPTGATSVQNNLERVADAMDGLRQLVHRLDGMLADVEKADPPPADHCGVSWCVMGGMLGRPHRDCREHYASDLTWAGVRATAYAHDRMPVVLAKPVWGEVDGLAPAVTLFVDEERNDGVEWGCDFTPAEALALADELVRAAATAMLTVRVD